MRLRMTQSQNEDDDDWAGGQDDNRNGDVERPAEAACDHTNRRYCLKAHGYCRRDMTLKTTPAVFEHERTLAHFLFAYLAVGQVQWNLCV